MNRMIKLTSIRLVLAVAGGLAVSAVSSQAQSATATISGVLVGSDWDYTITLQNTGNVALEGFWYAWTTSGNNLALPASNPGSSLGWLDSSLTGATSISYQGNAGDALGVGQSATFTFDSATDPIGITTSPSGESVAYTGSIGFTQGGPGGSSDVFSPTLVSTPEPSSVALAAIGCAGLILTKRTKLWRSVPGVAGSAAAKK
jgi:hypothetical protein